jgi:hypothetical protein
VIKEYRARLRAAVITLPIEGSGIVGAEEYFQDFPKGNLVGVEFNLNNLGVAGRSTTYLLVICRLGGSSGVSGLDTRNTLNPLKNSFGTPETASAQSCGLSIHL